MTEAEPPRWEGIPATELAERWGVARVHLFGSVGSTNDVARRLAAGGAPDATLVLAEEQTAGRGRMGRSWASPAGRGLWLSLLRRAAPGDAGVVPLRVGIAVAAAIDPFLAPSAAQLKWPNDVLAQGRKLGGILCEGIWDGDARGAVIVGVGLNVLQRPEDFPEEIRGTAASIACLADAAPDRAAVAAAVVRAVVAASGRGGTLTASEMAEFTARDRLAGRRVVVSDPVTGAPRAEGESLGIRADGALLLRLDAGEEIAIHSGTLRAAARPTS